MPPGKPGDHFDVMVGVADQKRARVCRRDFQVEQQVDGFDWVKDPVENKIDLMPDKS